VGILSGCGSDTLAGIQFFITIMAAMIILLCIKSIRCGKYLFRVVFFSGVIQVANFYVTGLGAQK
jgi:hypothetical protein